MTFAFADPPYLGMGSHYADLHPNALDCDDPEWHRRLVERLVDEFPDGWALCLHTPSLRTILPMCPPTVRVGAWTKPFCAFKGGVNPAYAWEPVIVHGGRKLDKFPKVRDYCAVSVALRTGFFGAKAEGMCWWVFDLLGATPDDQLRDLFPGSGAVSRAWESWKRYRIGLFTGADT